MSSPLGRPCTPHSLALARRPRLRPSLLPHCSWSTTGPGMGLYSDSQGIEILIHFLFLLSKRIDSFGWIAVRNSCFGGIGSSLNRTRVAFFYANKTADSDFGAVAEAVIETFKGRGISIRSELMQGLFKRQLLWISEPLQALKLLIPDSDQMTSVLEE